MHVNALDHDRLRTSAQRQLDNLEAIWLTAPLCPMKRKSRRRYIKLSDAQVLQDRLQTRVDQIKRASIAECLKKLAVPALDGRKARAIPQMSRITSDRKIR